jgi:hypothetical protein
MSRKKHYCSNLPVILISTYQWFFCPFKFDSRFISTLVIERTLRCKCPRCNRSANTKWWGMKASCKGHWFAHSTSREQCVWAHTPRSTVLTDLKRPVCTCFPVPVPSFLRDTTFFSLVHASGFWEDLRRTEKWIWRVSRVWRWTKTWEHETSETRHGDAFSVRCAEAFASKGSVLKGMVLRQWHEQSSGLWVGLSCVSSESLPVETWWRCL